MNEEQSMAAFFAKLAYIEPSQREEALNNSTFGNNYAFDYDYSTDENFVVIHKQSGQVIVGHRGTSNLADVGTDLALAAGGLHHSHRYHRAQALSHDVAHKYHDQDILHVGHSLGGTLADDLSRENGNRSITFNQGSSPLHHRQGSEEHQIIRTGNDPVSTFTEATKTIQAQSTPVEQKFDHLSSQLGTSFKPVAVQTYEAFQSHFLKHFNV